MTSKSSSRRTFAVIAAHPDPELELENNLLAKKLKSIHSGHSKLNFYSKTRIQGNETSKQTKENWFTEKEKAWELNQNNQRLANKLKFL